MAECIKSDGCQNRSRHCRHQFRINDGCLCNNRVIPKRLLVFCLILCQNRKAVSFASGSACRRNKNQRKGFVSFFYPVNIVKNISFIAGGKCHCLTAVHNASASQADDHITTFFFRNSCTLHGCRGKGIWLRLVKDHDFQALFFQKRLCPVQKPGSLCTVLSCNNHCLAPVFCSLLSQLFCLSGTKNQIDRKIMVKLCQHLVSSCFPRRR